MYIVKEHTRPVPEWAAPLLAAFGVNGYGQPRYRLVWGPSRLEVCGGYFQDVGRSEYRMICRYDDEAYVLEKYCEPHLYGTPSQWEAQNRDAWGFLTCGPYPHRGDYEGVHTFMFQGEFFQPVPALVYALALNVERGNLFSLTDKRIAIRDRKEAEQAAWEKKISDEFDEAMPLHYGPTTGYGGATNTADIDKIRMDRTVSDLPSAYRKAGSNSFTQL
jgi:hypothetical protein